MNAPGGLPLFRDADNYIEFVTLLGSTVECEPVICLAFCLMTTHYHLILNVEDNALAPAMKRLNWHYARAVNARIGGRGHVVGGRYFSTLVSDTDHLLTAFKYVVRNPVEAGMCRAPEDWQWSSYPGTIGLTPGFRFVDASLITRSVVGGADWLRRFVDGV